MTSDSWRITPGDLTDPRIVSLLDAHLTGMEHTAPRESRHALDLSGLAQPEISFWAIWAGDQLLGVGALKDLGQGHGEVKSMHTAVAARGQGVGGTMVRHIIDTARARGFSRLSLETGSMGYFAPAHALYRRHGFVDCPPFQGYRPDRNSIFLMLDLATSPATST
jgi:putative acetyltransferase